MNLATNRHPGTNTKCSQIAFAVTYIALSLALFDTKVWGVCTIFNRESGTLGRSKKIVHLSPSCSERSQPFSRWVLLTKWVIPICGRLDGVSGPGLGVVGGRQGKGVEVRGHRLPSPPCFTPSSRSVQPEVYVTYFNTSSKCCRGLIGCPPPD